MSNGAVSEEEIEAVEVLRSKGAYQDSLATSQSMLERTEDCGSRMRLLWNIASCAAFLERNDLFNQAMDELGEMPDPSFCQAIASMNRAYAEEQLGRPANALAILDMIFDAREFEREDCRIPKYQLLLFKGEALIHLRRATDALEWLDNAHALYPSSDSARNEDERRVFGWVEPSIQVNRANCLLTLDRFEEAFRAASEVLRWTDDDLATLARQYMAECRVWQGRVPEALEIYADLERRLPCRLVDEERIQAGITKCMSYLEKRRAISKPS
ncbi:MAG TPA: hypothetical protein VJX73_12875 [Terracidiphilus sp.]|nr:hypothetical protein [Terracidiphilus sp.]